MSRNHTPKEHPCFLCVKQFAPPHASGSLATGQRWSEANRRYIVFTGYICDMHATDDTRCLRWLETGKAHDA